MTNSTAKPVYKLLKVDIDKVLSAHRAKLRAGKSITRAQLVTMFNISNVSKRSDKRGTFAELQRENLDLVQLQNRINGLMSKSGLYLKSSGYYSSFEVRAKEDTKGEIVRHAGKIDTADYLELDLDQGMATRLSAGTWGTYNRVYNNKGEQKVPSAAPSPGSREALAKARIDKY